MINIVTDTKTYSWWQTGLIYQIYPRSFMDSNNDGIGDLAGIMQRLDYFKWLGIDAIWLSPIYPSPMHDYGYDISDYINIHPLFGTMRNFDDLLARAHQLNIKVILDLVPNHTSDEHPWFLEAKKSRDNPKRDWYLWANPASDGCPPNNWLSVFGGSAWEYDQSTEQYYYHAFLKQQPDLNWRNPDVQAAMFDVMRFWLNKGVDGFRIDVIWHLIKDQYLRDNPFNPDYRPGEELAYNKLLPVFSTDQPEVHDIITRMREVLEEYPERMMIGEVSLPIHKLVNYYGTEGRGVHMPFNFQLLHLPWKAQEVCAAINTYEAALPQCAWPNWVLGNHDNPRVMSRVGHEQARAAAVLLLTLRGTPVLYYGDEIGMSDGVILPEEVCDPQEKNQRGQGLGRDPERTPMQWDNALNAGFTRAKPWLPISPHFRRINVSSEQQDADSILSLYKRLIQLRRKELALQIGGYIPLKTCKNIIAYIREYNGRRLLIAINMGHRPGIFDCEQTHISGKIILATHIEKEGLAITRYLALEGDEAIIVELDKRSFS